jgi:anti-sigma factor RsiW
MIFAESRFRRDLGDLVDGRLEEVRRARLESHLEKCVECRREWHALASTRTTVRAIWTSVEVPAELSSDIRAALDGEDRVTRLRAHGNRRLRRFLALSAAAAAIAAIVFLAISREDDPPSAAARDWKRWKSGRIHLELQSGSAAAISHFFADRGVPFRVPTEMIVLSGYRLLGARVHSLVGRTSTFSVYRGRRNETVICQMYEAVLGDLPAGGRVVERDGARFFVFRASDLTQVFWQDGPIVCVLVSDSPPEELVRLALAKIRRA